MDQARAEVRWGSGLNVSLTGRGVIDGQKRLVQVDERFSRAWLLRYHVQASRPLIVGEQINARFTFSEGQGSSAVRYTRTLTINPPDAEVGPISEWVSLVQMTVDLDFLNSGANDTLSVVGSAWIAPASPVYPLPRTDGL